MYKFIPISIPIPIPISISDTSSLLYFYLSNDRKGYSHMSTKGTRVCGQQCLRSPIRMRMNYMPYGTVIDDACNNTFFTFFTNFNNFCLH